MSERVYKKTKEARENIAKNHADFSGKNNPNWKGGRSVNHKGYIFIHSPNHPFANRERYVFEHRLVAEKELGRFLKDEEEVHHINKIKSDNRLENLMVFATQSAHLRFELGSWYGLSEIVFDGRELACKAGKGVLQ